MSKSWRGFPPHHHIPIPQGHMMRRVSASAIVTAVVLVLVAGSTSMAQGAVDERAKRSFRVDDMLSREELPAGLQRVAFSRAGESVAFLKQRPQVQLRDLRLSAMTFFNGTDVWVQLKPGEPAFNATHGGADSSSWWAPSWSPDGRYLAMLSTRAGNVTLWIWSAATKQLHQVDTRGWVEAPFINRGGYEWLDDDQILIGLRTDGRNAENSPALTGMRIATEGWAAYGRGEVTASVLRSGDKLGDPGSSIFPEQLVLINVANRKKQVLADGARVFAVQVAPDRSAIAFWRYVRSVAPVAGEPVRFDEGTIDVALEVVSLHGKLLARTNAVSGALLDTLSWSPRSDELAFWSRPLGDATHSPLLQRAALQTRKLAPLDLTGLKTGQRFSKPEWTAIGELLVYATSGDSAQRGDWWAIDRKGQRRLLTSEMAAVPTALTPVAKEQTFVGVAAGAIWKVDPQASRVTKVFGSDDLAVIGGLRLPQSARNRDGYTHALFNAGSRGRVQFEAAIELSSGRYTKLKPSSENATLVAYAPGQATEGMVFYSDDATGSRLSRVLPDGSVDILLEANAHLREIAEGEFQRFSYVASDGKTLSAWMLLPPDYQARRRYPVVTFVYPGSIAGSGPPYRHRTFGAAYSLNAQILAAQGYVVLFPSMPISSSDQPTQILQYGVAPAVDKLIESGIADESRLFLLGESFGGYAVNAVITQTDRFAAAVSIAGVSNPLSKYGQTFLYADAPSSAEFWYYESGQGQLKNPPWTDIEHYVRNAPLASIEKVRTPLMLIHGDLDDLVSIAQSTEMFQALYRQGQRAEFVRYWGEGHVFLNPANIRDMWARIFAWFDDCGNIARDRNGTLLWDKDRVAQRAGPPTMSSKILGWEKFFDQSVSKQMAQGVPVPSQSPSAVTNSGKGS